MKTNTATRWLTGLTLALGLAGLAPAAEVAGVKLDDTVKVAGKELKLNGAGVRTRIVVKVYVLGLYLTEKKDTAAGVLEAPGPRRFTLTMMREVTGDELGQAFMAGITANTDKAEKGKLVNQMVKLGEVFQTVGSLKKGDTLTVDWVAEKGTLIELNGKSQGDPLPDVAFYNALLKIWIGDKPADSALKPLLLGAKPTEAAAGTN